MKSSQQNTNQNIDEIAHDILTKWREKIVKIDQEFLSQADLSKAMKAGINKRATAMDNLLTSIAQHTLPEKELIICAIGGYGRRKLAPYSDIDIAFIYKDTAADHIQDHIAKFEQILWDGGLKPSLCVFAEQEFEQVCFDDHQRMTCFLDMRHVYGNVKLYKSLEQEFRTQICTKDQSIFIAKKLQERNERHTKMGLSRYCLEPNIKENKGGLRDLQCLHWITNYLYNEESIHILQKKGILSPNEAAEFYNTSDFLWVVRTHLHLIAGKAHETLNFDHQLDLAEKMGYVDTCRQKAAEQFMKDYFKIARKVGYLTRIFCAILEEESLASGLTEAKLNYDTVSDKDAPYMKGLKIKNGRITIPDEIDFSVQPEMIIYPFHLRQIINKPLHPQAIRRIANEIEYIQAEALQENDNVNQLFLSILMTPDHSETMLRLMQEIGVLAKTIPAFGAIEAHMQYDRYHVFTADEHLIYAIGLMHKLNNGQLSSKAVKATRIINKITEKRVLFMAITLHDIAKGTGEDHSIAGARIADTLCPRLGLSEHETKLVSWLVLNHLDMSKMALNRDIFDPKTITDFCQKIPNLEYLRLLYVLTVVDIMAVGPDRWNSWKEKLLDQLYDFSYKQLTGQSAHDQTRIEDKKSKLSNLTKSENAENFIKFAPQHYWYAFDIETIKTHLEQIEAPDHKCNTRAGSYQIHATIDDKARTTRISIYGDDKKGIFSRLLKGFIDAQSYIIDAQIFTSHDGRIFDIFTIQNKNHDAYDNLNYLFIKISQSIENIENNASKNTHKYANSETIITLDNQASHDNTLIEINSQDRFGLLYDIGKALTDLNLQIISAKVSTYGQNVVDVFYVRDAYGLKITNAQAKNRIIQSLKAKLT